MESHPSNDDWGTRLSERIFLRAYLPQSISSSERIFIRAYLRQCTSRLGRDLGRGAKSLHESFAGGLSCSLLEELGRSFHDANFFGDRRRDPLVQRHAIFFREPLVLCPATSWHKSGAVILGEARAHVLLISCRDPSRPEGHSGGQPLPSVVRIKMTNHREHRGSQELIGVGQPWKGTPFRRAVHLIWRTYGTAEQVAEERTFKYRSG